MLTASVAIAFATGLAVGITLGIGLCVYLVRRKSPPSEWVDTGEAL